MSTYEADLAATVRAMLARHAAGADVGEFLVAAVLEAQATLDKRHADAESTRRPCECGHAFARHEVRADDAPGYVRSGPCGVRPYGQSCGCPEYWREFDASPAELTGNRPGSWEAALLEQMLEAGGYGL